MDAWWYVLVIVVILAVAVAAILYLRSRDRDDGNASAPLDSPRHYGEEREVDRIGGMSAEDRDWEAASQDRNRRAQERDATAPTDAGDDQR